MLALVLLTPLVQALPNDPVPRADAPHLGIVKDLPLKAALATKSDWHAVARQPEGSSGPENDPRLGEVPAELCFYVGDKNRGEGCHPIRSALPDGSMTYSYQTVTDLSIRFTKETGPLVLFTAEFSGGGSDVLRQTSFWRYNAPTDSMEPAGNVTRSLQDQATLFDTGPLTGMLVTSTYRWGAGEAHFDPHHFFVEVYRWIPGVGFGQVLGFLTPGTYARGEEDGADVPVAETARIVRLLAAAGSAD